MSVIPNSATLRDYATYGTLSLRVTPSPASLLASLPRHSTASLPASLLASNHSHRHPPSLTLSLPRHSPRQVTHTVTHSHSHCHPHRHPPSLTPSLPRVTPAGLNVHLITDQHYSRPISCLPVSTTLLHYLSLPSVLPDCRRARVFIALPDVPMRVRSQGPGPRAGAVDLNKAPPQRQLS